MGSPVNTHAHKNADFADVLNGIFQEMKAGRPEEADDDIEVFCVGERFPEPVEELLALVVGLGFSAAGLGVPGALATGLGALSELALPIALLCVGASLQVVRADLDVGLTGSVVAMKIGLMPAVAWVVFTLLAVDPTAATAVVVMLGMPSAVSTYVYASELGGDSQLASLNVFATTLASVGTVAVILHVMG